MSQSSENIKVVVRVRSFIDREKAASSPCIIAMEGQSTTLFDLRDGKVPSATNSKKFIFDHSYWSHDGFKIDNTGYAVPVNSHYVDQARVYEEVGSEMLANAWDGYNCTLFAYGQTGSGKSYTIMGYEPNIGLVPRLCSDLFRQSSRKKSPGITHEITFSMLEIYNENVRDLLSGKKGNDKPSLHVRQGKQGFYADGLTERPVADYQAIKASLAEGDRNRSLAATKMNETSSRAHTIVTVKLRQNFSQTNTTKLASINLVDLAGSERQQQAQTEGDRFKEATKINQSLSTLGNVLEALVKSQQSNKGEGHIPFRNSKLTMLLKHALGGNSKAIMVATISPALENYEQTLSTLKYADRTKKIRNRAQVNQVATDKLVQQLLDEKNKLLKELELSRSRSASGLSSEELARVKEEHENEIRRYKQEMEDIQTSWAERLDSEQKRKQERIDELEAEEKKKDRIPYLWNLNEDLSLCAKIIHFLPDGEVNKIGNTKAEPTADIMLSGPGYCQQHATAKFVGSKMSIKPLQGKVWVNGREVTENKSLHHNDRVCFGGRAIFVVSDPRKVAKLKKEGRQMDTISYEFARKELDRKIVDSIDGDESLKQEVMSIIPLVRDANAISEELAKMCTFQELLVSALARGLQDGRTEVYVRMTNESTGNSYLWPADKFSRRHGVMMDLFTRYQNEGGKVLDELDELDDPFYEPPETECLVGIAAIPLVSLSIMDGYSDQLQIMNYDAKRVGSLDVELVPCDSSGKEECDYGFEEFSDLMGNDLYFKVKIIQANNIPNNFTETWCRFKFFNFHQSYQSDKVPGINPRYGFSRRMLVSDAGHQFEDYVMNQDLCIEIWGHQNVQRDPNKILSPSDAIRKKNMELDRLKAEKALLKSYLGDLEAILDKGEFCKNCLSGPVNAMKSKLDDLENELYQNAVSEDAFEDE